MAYHAADAADARKRIVSFLAEEVGGGSVIVPCTLCKDTGDPSQGWAPIALVLS